MMSNLTLFLVFVAITFILAKMVGFFDYSDKEGKRYPYEVKFVGKRNREKLKVVKTTCDIDVVNKAVAENFKIVIRKVKAIREIDESELPKNYAIIRNKETGLFHLMNECDEEIFDKKNRRLTSEDLKLLNKRYSRYELMGYNKPFPFGFKEPNQWEYIVIWTDYPFVGYIIPKDVQIGERVYIEDMIEKYVVYSRRVRAGTHIELLKSCEAIWNGSDLEIAYPKQTHIIG